MFSRLEADIKAALLSGDKERARALAFLKSSLTTAAKDQSLELTDDVVTTLLRKELKRRNEAAELFMTGGNLASAEKEKSEAELISSYLPPELNDEQVREKLNEIMTREALPKENASLGKLISTAKAELGTSADPSHIARLAQQILRGDS